MVETERPPDLERTMSFPAPVTTTVQEARDCGHYCVATVAVLQGVLQGATIPDGLRRKIEGLVERQREIAKRFETALWEASREMKTKEQGMLELPLSPSHNRPPATGRFVICEAAGCGGPMRTAQAEATLKRHGNRLCPECQARLIDGGEVPALELPLEGTATSEAPQAFR